MKHLWTRFLSLRLSPPAIFGASKIPSVRGNVRLMRGRPTAAARWQPSFAASSSGVIELARRKTLVAERDTRKRDYCEMISSEQALVEDFETGQLQNISRVPDFRGFAPVSQVGQASAASSGSAGAAASKPETRDDAATEHVAAAASAREPGAGQGPACRAAPAARGKSDVLKPSQTALLQSTLLAVAGKLRGAQK